MSAKLHAGDPGDQDPAHISGSAQHAAGQFGEHSAQAGQAAILVVEDEEVVLSLTEAVLQDQGFRVFCARNGHEALKTMQSHSDVIELALLDWVLPLMSGKQLFKRFQDLKPEMKVVLTSGYPPDSDINAMLAAGAAGFLQKPYTPERLTATVRAALQQ